jgi:hypothetical protein
MAQVSKVGKDRFAVSGFLQSMPDLTYEVFFQGNTPRVVAREGCTGDEWDKHAISAVQAALIMETVVNAST